MSLAQEASPLEHDASSVDTSCSPALEPATSTAEHKVQKQGKRKQTMAVYYRSQGEKISKQLDATLKSPVHLKPERIEQLAALKRSGAAEDCASGPPRLTLINVDDQLLTEVQRSCKVHIAHSCIVGPSDFKQGPSSIGAEEAEADGVLLQCSGTRLSSVEKIIIAAAFFASRLVMVVHLSEEEGGGTELREDVAAYTNSVCSVFLSPEALSEHLAGPFVEQVALLRAVAADVAQRIAPLARQSKVKHFLTRGSVALVPCGVMALNFASIMRLVRRMMAAVGCAPSAATAKQATARGAAAGAVTVVANSAGDVYQAAVVGTILAECSAGLASGGLTAALATVQAADAALLGSVCVVTGAISAVTDYMTRPALVRSLGRYLAALQVAHELYPQLRGGGGGGSGGSSGGGGGGGSVGGGGSGGGGGDGGNDSSPTSDTETEDESELEIDSEAEAAAAAAAAAAEGEQWDWGRAGGDHEERCCWGRALPPDGGDNSEDSDSEPGAPALEDATPPPVLQPLPLSPMTAAREGRALPPSPPPLPARPAPKPATT